jgi:hypothetical protein
MEFKFARHRIDKRRPDEVLPILLHAAKHFGYRVFTMRELGKAKLGVSRGGVESAFGSWPEAMRVLRNALAKDGLSLAPRQTKRVSDEQLFLELERVWQSLGHRPSRYEWEMSEGKFAYRTYRVRFGGWVKACLSFLEWRMGGRSIEINDSEVAEPSTVQDPNLPTASKVAVSRRNPPDRLRLRVLDRDAFRCVLCGRSPATERGVVLHLDHIIPFSDGGQTVFENLRTLCETCNQGRGNVANLARESI